MLKKYLYDGSKKFDRKKFDTSETGLFSSRQEAQEKSEKNLNRINELQQRFYADQREGIIFLFQAMDAAGKDGTIRAVLSCLSPHGVTEYAFKAPSAEELSHGFMWRISRCAPQRGHIAIFNRSQYEDVLIGKVHRLYMNQPHAKYIDDDQIIDDRYDDIVNFEKYLYNNSVRTVKIYLNISKDEQARRFLSRIDEPEKNWKFANEDIKERGYWEDYQKALEDAINKTATGHCPWYIVPADHKWYMRYLVSQIIRETLEDIDPQFPTVSADQKAAMLGFAPKLRDELHIKAPSAPEGSHKSDTPKATASAPKDKRESDVPKATASAPKDKRESDTPKPDTPKPRKTASGTKTAAAKTPAASPRKVGRSPKSKKPETV